MATLKTGVSELFRDERFGIDVKEHTGLEANLKDQRRRLIDRRTRLAAVRTVALLAAGTAWIGAPLLLLWATPKPAATLAIAGGLLFVLFLITRGRMRELGEEIDKTDNDLDVLTIESESEESRAQRLFQVHSRQLKQYYDQALQQSAYIFWVGMTCILLGFLVIGAAFWLIQSPLTTTASEKILVGALGAVGGVLANFIAALYLGMHSRTVQSRTEFHNRLVLTHHLHFGNLLVAKITNETLRNATLGLIAQALAVSLGKQEAEVLRELTAPTTATIGGDSEEAPVATADVRIQKSDPPDQAGRLRSVLAALVTSPDRSVTRSK